MRRFCFLLFVLPLMAFSCNGQNGPTLPSVSLTWTQAANYNGVPPFANCVYRGATAGVYTKPALYCSPTAIIAYVDNTVQASTTYHYAVTAQFGSPTNITETAYSNDALAAIGAAPGSPSGLNDQTVAFNQTSPDLALRPGVLAEQAESDGVLLKASMAKASVVWETCADLHGKDERCKL